MNCDEVEELAGAYALYALPPDELEAVQAHLARCSKHADIAEFVAVAAAIALQAPEMEPPPRLRDRLMAAVRAEAPRLPSVAQGEGFLDRLMHWFSGRNTGWALAGGLAVLVVALAGWNASLQSSGDDFTVTQLSGAEGVTGRVVYIEDESVAVMTVEGLQTLPADSTYQVWAISSGTPEGIGFLSPTGAGETIGAIEADLSGADQVAVTIEPAGGSLLPTTEPVLAGDL